MKNRAAVELGRLGARAQHAKMPREWYERIGRKGRALRLERQRAARAEAEPVHKVEYLPCGCTFLSDGTRLECVGCRSGSTE